jgi:hypothetical protein
MARERTAARAGRIGATAVRWTLGVLAAALVVWAFARVGWREFHRASGGRDGIVLTVLHWSGEGGPEEDAIVNDSLRAFERANPGITVRREGGAGARLRAVPTDVLDLLADDFRAHGRDLRRLLAGIASTRAFRLASTHPLLDSPGGGDRVADAWSAFPLTPLAPQQVIGAMVATTSPLTLLISRSRCASTR